MPEYFHAAYIFGFKINTAISANKQKYTFLLVTSVDCFHKNVIIKTITKVINVKSQIINNRSIKLIKYVAYKYNIND